MAPCRIRRLPLELGGPGDLWAHDSMPGKGIRWYRQTIFIPEPLNPLRAMAICQRAIVCASELYWDGVLISQNGRIGAIRNVEIPGRSAQFTIVPPHLAKPGRHVVALRVSNAHTFSGFLEAPLQIGYFDNILDRQHLSQTLLLLCTGIFLITAIFHIALLWGRTKGVAYAIFSLLCLSCAVYLLIDAWVHFFPISLAHYYTIALFNDVPWFCMMTLLPIFFLFEFSLPWRRMLSYGIVAIALTCIVPPRLIMFGLLPVSWLPTFELMNQVHMYAITLFAAVISLINIFRRKNGSLLALAGCAALLTGIFLSSQIHIEYGWALGFCVLIVFLTASLARQMAQQNRMRLENEMRSTRLELELLKKHIQPHFLLNSLNSIIAWLEESPQNAVRLVTALAEELRLILQFSKEQLVPVNEELRLCRLHLDVMGLRQDKHYDFTTDTVPDEEMVPPLVFHTLVENGLTHGYAGKNSGTFVFHREVLPKAVKYSIFNDSVTAKNKKPASRPSEGTGLMYVKTRLQEAYPNAWKMESGPKENGWEARIEIAKN
jgi:hypothetical protein